MNVLMINGSPHKNGNTATALGEMEKVFSSEGVDVTTLWVGEKAIRGCIACYKCRELGHCVFNDDVNEIAPLFEKADALVLGTPVYYASANSTLTALLDRLFYSTPFDKSMKVGAAIAVARRGGLSSTFDELNKYFSISQMPIATSCYWNCLHGQKEGEVTGDLEGIRTVRTLAHNITFLIKAIKLGKEKFGLPPAEPPARTNFIH